MNRKLIDFYTNRLENENLTERSIMQAFLAGVSYDCMELVKSAVDKLPDKKIYGERFPIGYAIEKRVSPEIIRILLDAGFKLPNSRVKFNALNGSPADLIDLMMSTGLYSKEEAVEELAEGTYSVLRSLDPEKEEYAGTPILDFFDYFSDWFEDLIRLLSSEDSSKEKYAQILADLAEFDRVAEPFDTYLKLFGDIIAEEDRTELINKTIELDNKPGFDTLLKYWPNLIREVKIYPASDMEILDELVANNVLVPGTDEAFDAFNEFIARGGETISGDILFKVLHDSYLSMQDKESNEIPLIKAIRYTNCSLDELRRFIPSPEYINLQDTDGCTALHHVAIKHFPLEYIQELIERGADPLISDNKGNNVLHYVAQYYNLEKFKACAALLPAELQSQTNKDNETPEDRYKTYEDIVYL